MVEVAQYQRGRSYKEMPGLLSLFSHSKLALHAWCFTFIFVLLYFDSTGWGVEHTVLWEVCKWSTPPAPFVLAPFEMGLTFIPKLVWVMILLSVLPHVGGNYRCLPPCPALSWDAHVSLECDPPNLCLPSSWNYRFEPLYPAHKFLGHNFPCTPPFTLMLHSLETGFNLQSIH
jgi:hypothetical protein